MITPMPSGSEILRRIFFKRVRSARSSIFREMPSVPPYGVKTRKRPHGQGNIGGDPRTLTPDLPLGDLH